MAEVRQARLDRGFCKSHAHVHGKVWDCTNKAVKDGYCGIHKPEAVKRREAKKDELIKKKMLEHSRELKARIEFQRRALAYPRLMRKIERLKAMLNSRSPK